MLDTSARTVTRSGEIVEQRTLRVTEIAARDAALPRQVRANRFGDRPIAAAGIQVRQPDRRVERPEQASFPLPN